MKPCTAKNPVSAIRGPVIRGPAVRGPAVRGRVTSACWTLLPAALNNTMQMPEILATPEPCRALPWCCTAAVGGALIEPDNPERVLAAFVRAGGGAAAPRGRMCAGAGP